MGNGLDVHSRFLCVLPVHVCVCMSRMKCVCGGGCYECVKCAVRMPWVLFPPSYFCLDRTTSCVLESSQTPFSPPSCYEDFPFSRPLETFVTIRKFCLLCEIVTLEKHQCVFSTGGVLLEYRWHSLSSHKKRKL